MSDFLSYLLPTFGSLLAAVLSAASCYLIAYINKKKVALQASLDNDTASKYLDMIAKTIEDCVIATNQTYVNKLKDEGAFTEEAQKEAFKRTLDAVMGILTDDCIEYIESITKDVETYLVEKIESCVSKNKKEA